MNKSVLFTLYVILLTPMLLMGQNRSLFETIEFQKVSQTKLQTDELDRTYIRFYDGLFKSAEPFASETIAFNLDGKSREFTITNRAEYYQGVYSVIAKEFQTGSLFIATVQGNRFTAKLDDHLSITTLHIRYDESNNEHYLTTLDLTALDKPFCGFDDHTVSQFYSDVLDRQVISESSSKTGSFKQSTFKSSIHDVDAISSLSSLEDKSTIDILYVYTDAAQEFAETCQFNGYPMCESINTIEAYLAQTTILTQSTFDNSGIAIELRPVFNYKVNYDETTDGIGSSERLYRLISAPGYRFGAPYDGYFDDVHAIRDDVGADIIAGIFVLDDAGGIAPLLTSPRGGPQGASASLNDIQVLLARNVFAHELGHNFGNDHSRTQRINAANKYGGLFHYSMGYQWVTEDKAFSSVMAYTEDKITLNGDTVRTIRVPVFSSPDVLWDGVAAGTTDRLIGPTDATMSNKQIKLSIANYRPTTVDVPEIVLDQEAITVSMNREDRSETPLVITNTGGSNLMWRVAVKPVGLSKSVSITEEGPFNRPDSPLRSYKALVQSDVGVVYSEGFEGFRSRFVGYQANQGWRTLSENNLFKIKSNNPSSGENHLQLTASQDSSYTIQSPFFGPQLEGTFEVSFDLSITKDRVTNGFNLFYIHFYDAVNGAYTAGILVDGSLNLYTAIPSEQAGFSTFNDTGEVFESNTSDNNSYRTVRIKLNATTSRLEYYLDDVLVSESPYVNGEVIDEFFVTMYGATHPLGMVDIDNIEIHRPYLFDWLDIDDVAGAVDPGQKGTVNLSFNTVGVDAGVYQTKLQLINNSQSSIVEIPVTLSVSTAVSNEEDPLRPSEFRLSPAYPNPFNPETTLSFEIPEASVVSLEVFDVLGRRVKTLANEPFATGTHAVTLDATSLSSGLYLVRMQAGNFVTTQQVSLIK